MQKISVILSLSFLIVVNPAFAFNSAFLNKLNSVADQVCGTVIQQGSYQEESLNVKIDGLTPEMAQQLKSQYSLPNLIIENGTVVINHKATSGMKQEDAMRNNMEVRRCRQSVAQIMIENQH